MHNGRPVGFADARVIGGVITEFVSGIVFYLYFRCASQLSSFCICIERTSRFLLANKMCDVLESPEKEKTRADLIKTIANAPMITADQMNLFNRRYGGRIHKAVNSIDSSMS